MTFTDKQFLTATLKYVPQTDISDNFIDECLTRAQNIIQTLITKPSVFLSAEDFNAETPNNRLLLQRATAYLAHYWLVNGIYKEGTSTSVSLQSISLSESNPRSPDFIPNIVFNILSQTPYYSRSSFLSKQELDTSDDVFRVNSENGFDIYDGKKKAISWAQAYTLIRDNKDEWVKDFLKNDSTVKQSVLDLITRGVVDAEITRVIAADPNKYKGAKGDQGPQGPQGPQGAPGPKGDQGPKPTLISGLIFENILSNPALINQQNTYTYTNPKIFSGCDLIVVQLSGKPDSSIITGHIWKGQTWESPNIYSIFILENINFIFDKQNNQLKINYKTSSSSSIVAKDIYIRGLIGYTFKGVQGPKGEKGDAGGLPTRLLNPTLKESYLTDSKNISIQYNVDGSGDSFLMSHWGQKRSDGFYQNKTEIFKVQPGANPTTDIKLGLNTAETSIINPTKNGVNILDENETKKIVDDEVKILRADFEHDLEHIEDASGYHTIYNQHFEKKELNGTLKQEGVIRCDWLDIQNSANVDSDDDWMDENTKYIIEIDYEYPLGSSNKNINTLQLFAENLAIPNWKFLWRYGGSWNPRVVNSSVAIGVGWLEFTFSRTIKIIIEVDVWNNSDGSRNYSFVIKGVNQKSDNYVSFRCWAKKFNVAPANFIKNISLVSKIGSGANQFKKPEHLNIKIKKEVHH